METGYVETVPEVAIVGPPLAAVIEVSREAFIGMGIDSAGQVSAFQAGILVVPPLLSLPEMIGIHQGTGVAFRQDQLRVIVEGAQAMIQLGSDDPAGIRVEHIGPTEVLVASRWLETMPETPRLIFLIGNLVPFLII